MKKTKRKKGFAYYYKINSIQTFKQHRFFQAGAHREESFQSTPCNSVTQHPLIKNTEHHQNNERSNRIIHNKKYWRYTYRTENTIIQNHLNSYLAQNAPTQYSPISLMDKTLTKTLTMYRLNTAWQAKQVDKGKPGNQQKASSECNLHVDKTD